ncbi:MAG: hypothetical protein FWG31_03020 [Oscillospiraceae bacterium]|nr:hypothetical protein [Oscillospiraceae bacterium]
MKFQLLGISFLIFSYLWLLFWSGAGSRLESIAHLGFMGFALAGIGLSIFGCIKKEK